MADNTYLWTKKCDDLHFTVGSEATTLCGRPMLGNNYAKVYEQFDPTRTTCAKCKEELKNRNLFDNMVEKGELP